MDRVIAVLFARIPWHQMGWGGQPHAPAAYAPGKDPIAIVQEAGLPPGSIWTGGNSRPTTGIRSRTITRIILLKLYVIFLIFTHSFRKHILLYLYKYSIYRYMHISLQLDERYGTGHTEAALLQPTPCFQIIVQRYIALQR